MPRIFYLILVVVLIHSLSAQHCDNLLIALDKVSGQNFILSRKALNEIVTSSSGNNSCLANAYRRLGTLFKNNGQPDSSIFYFLNAYSFSVKSKDTLSQASNLNQIATVYSEQKNLKQAIRYFRMAFEVYHQISHYRGMSDATFNIAETQFNEGQSDSAFINCLQSLAYMRSWSDTATVGYNYDLLSRIRLRQKEPNNALHFSNLAIYLFRTDKDYSGLIPALYQSGKIHMQIGRPDSACKQFNEAYTLANTGGYKEMLPDIAKLLAEVYEQKGMQDSAVKYLKLQQTFTESLNSERRQLITTEMLTRFDTERKEIALQNEKQLSASRNTMNIALSILSLVLFLSIFLLWRNFRQRKKIQTKESELNHANAMLRGQDEERERIARELHDRVGSMLSTVKLHFSSMEEHMSDMLQQQGRSYQKAIGLLDETYEEVRRISHDLDTGLLGRFGLRTAMLQLVQLISSTNKLKVLYIDNELPPEIYKAYETDLYRITQELLSNTIKYAGAKEISIQISRNNGNLVYSYEDDGQGFSKEQLKEAKGIGYKNIEARVNKMKGHWHLDTSPGNGLNLIIEIPIGEHTNNHS